MPDYTYAVSDSALVFSFPDIGPSCVPNEVYDSTLSDLSPLPAFITFNPASFSYSVYTTDNADINSYSISLFVSYSTFSIDTTFTLTVTPYNCLSTLTIPDYTYTLQSPTLLIPISDIGLSCSPSEVYSSTLIDDSALPSFINFDPTSLQFTIYSTLAANVNAYSVKVTVT